MTYLKLILGLSLLIGQFFVQSLSSSGLMDGKVYINLYYESKCPDSKRFINNQIDRALEKFPGLINFSFVPYGFVNVRVYISLSLKNSNYYCDLMQIYLFDFTIVIKI